VPGFFLIVGIESVAFFFTKIFPVLRHQFLKAREVCFNFGFCATQPKADNGIPEIPWSEQIRAGYANDFGQKK